MADGQAVNFGDICKEIKITTKDPIADGYEHYIGLEHLDSGSLKIKRWGSISEDKPSFTRVFRKGQILFGKRRPYLRKAAIAEFDGICSGDIIVMEPKGELLLNGLLPIIVQSKRFWDWAIKTSSGSLSPRTKFQLLSEYKVPIPSTSIQQSLLLRFETINNLEKHLNLAEESGLKFLSVLNSMFFTINTTDTLGVLGDVIEKLLPGKSVKSSSRPAGLDEIGVLKVSAVSSGTYKPIENKLVTDFQELTKLVISPVEGDILLTRANTPDLVGDSCLVENAQPNVFIPDKIWKVIVKPNIDRSWLRHLLLYLRLNGNFSAIASGTSGSMKNISQEKMLAVRVKIPSENEQKLIGLMLDKLSDTLHRLLLNNRKLGRLKNSLLEL